MSSKFSQEKHQQAMADLRRQRIKHDQSYRAQALKLFPHVCGSCGREFEGVSLKRTNRSPQRLRSHKQPARRQQLGTALPLLS